MDSVDTVVAASSQPRRLVVLVPGFRGRCARWADLQKRLGDEPGFRPHEARWLHFDHAAHHAGFGSLQSLAKRLRGRIDAEWIQHGNFDEVVLVGHSMGGLIVRYAYMLALGAISNEPLSAWGERVVRIVLLASLNRGIDPKRTWLIRPIAWLTRVMPFVPRLRGLDVLRGSAFLTDLKICWIRKFGELTRAESDGTTWRDGRPVKPPLVVQILGTNDGVVTQDDSKDVFAFPNGHSLEVPDADHAGLHRLDIAPDPELRYAILRRGFAGVFDDDAARVAKVQPGGDPVKRVVCLLHGIRASNVDEWIAQLRDRIKARSGGDTLVGSPTYGYFSALRFVLHSVRRKNFNVFQDWYTDTLAEHPNAEFSLIGHSNGTYILGQSLSQIPAMRFTNVALAGSVLPTNFSW